MHQPRCRATGGPAKRQMRLEARQAAQARAFAVMLQPRLALGDGSLRAMEAQLRWKPRHVSFGAAAALLPPLDESGQSAPMEGWVLQEACRAAMTWQDVPVAVALAGDSLRQGVLLEQVGQALDMSGLPADRLEIALPFSALSGAASAGSAFCGGDDTLLALAALRDAGVAVALDAFGAHEACLLTLQRLPLTAVKLDRCLVRDLPGDRDAVALSHALIGFARAMGIRTVATGLETAAQLEWLRQAGCDEGQGSMLGAARQEVGKAVLS